MLGRTVIFTAAGLLLLGGLTTTAGLLATAVAVGQQRPAWPPPLLPGYSYAQPRHPGHRWAMVKYRTPVKFQDAAIEILLDSSVSTPALRKVEIRDVGNSVVATKEWSATTVEGTVQSQAFYQYRIRDIFSSVPPPSAAETRTRTYVVRISAFDRREVIETMEFRLELVP